MLDGDRTLRRMPALDAMQICRTFLRSLAAIWMHSVGALTNLVYQLYFHGLIRVRTKRNKCPSDHSP